MRTVVGLRVIGTAHNVLAMHHDGRQIEPALLDWARSIAIANSQTSEGEPVIDHPTYDSTIRKPWLTPDPIEAAGLGVEPNRDAIETEPADLDDMRSGVQSTGILLAICATFAGILLGYGLASRWPAFVAWGL